MFFRRRDRVKPRQFVPGVYLTDGRSLFQVTSVLVGRGSMLVSIEDCLTLETRDYAAVELKAMPLRLLSGKLLDGGGRPECASVRPPSHPLQIDHDIREAEHDLDRI
jgi:hypothetical protein